MTNQEYKTGYGRPPEEHRFRPGQSGNRNGRPRGSKNTYTLLNEILDKKIPLKENGQTFRLSKRAAILMQLVNKAVKGETKAISVLMPHILMADMKDEERNKVLAAMNIDDQEIVNLYLAGCAQRQSLNPDGQDEGDEEYKEQEEGENDEQIVSNESDESNGSNDSNR